MQAIIRNWKGCFMKTKKSFFRRSLVSLNVLFLLCQFLIMTGYFPLKGLLPAIFIPLLSVINLVFFVYWILRMQWPFVLFLIFFLLNFQEWSLLYRFPNNAIVVSEGFKVMSYNVRLFNEFKWINNKQVPIAIESFVYEENPDILCLQEYSSSTAPSLKRYPYRYIKTAAALGNNGVAIFSKFPLIQTGQIDFDNSYNSGIYADIRFQEDTLRIYNLHLESYQLQKNDSLTDPTRSVRLVRRLEKIYQKQLDQVLQWQQVENFNEYPSLICVDLNNTAFSDVYRNLRGPHNDAFVEAGKGFGATYSLGGIPYRIDFIFSSNRLKVLDYFTHDIKLSDHQPISAKFNWN